MSGSAKATAVTRSAEEIVRASTIAQAANGVRYSSAGETAIDGADLERLVNAVPRNVAGALSRKAYYFVPLTIGEGESTLVSEGYDVGLSDRAVCHRNLSMGDTQCCFISTRLMDDKFSVAFEFYINVGHAFVEQAGVAKDFADLVWKQVESGVRGETSLDAYDFRRQALKRPMEPVSEDDEKSTKARKLALPVEVADEKAKNGYLNAAFSDAIAIYILSLYIDVDYYDLREREYPLLAPTALAERLRKVAALFPASPGYEFAVYYRRRN